MVPLIAQLNTLLKREVSRREALFILGGILIAVVGVPALFRRITTALMHGHKKESLPSNSGGSGYGGSPYGV